MKSMKTQVTQSIQPFGGGALTANLAPYTAFTLAEMMVVLLIISIVLACMAPVVTTKMKADQHNVQTSPWQWARNNIDAFFSAGSNQSAMIGQNEKSDTDSAKLIINNSTGLDDLILFKNGENVLGSIRFSNDGLRIGSSDSEVGQGSVGVGRGITATSNSVVYGTNANGGNDASVFGNAASATDSGDVAIGFGATASSNDAGASALGSGAKASAFGATAVGHFATASGIGSIALGESAHATNVDSVAIGNATASGEYSIAFASGNNFGRGGAAPLTTTATSANSIAIGTNTHSEADQAIAIGTAVNAKGEYSIAIGNSSLASQAYGIAIGYGAKAPSTVTNNSAESSVAIGYKAMGNATDGNSTYSNVAIGHQTLLNTTAGYNVAIGHKALMANTTGSDNIAIGSFAMDAVSPKNYNTAIGYSSCRYVKGSKKTCIGYNAGPASSDALAAAKNDDKVIFLGDSETTVYIPGNLVVGKDTILGADSANKKGGNPYRVYLKGGNKSYDATWVYLGTDDYKGDDDNFYKVNPITVGPFNIGSGDAFDDAADHNPPNTSDRRLKYVGKENTDGLAKLRQLKIFNYTFKKDETKTPRVGVMAQDLQKVFPNAVKKGADGFLTIRMEDMFYAVINAIKELDARITRLEKENKELKTRLDKLESKLK